MPSESSAAFSGPKSLIDLIHEIRVAVSGMVDVADSREGLETGYRQVVQRLDVIERSLNNHPFEVEVNDA